MHGLHHFVTQMQFFTVRLVINARVLIHFARSVRMNYAKFRKIFANAPIGCMQALHQCIFYQFIVPSADQTQ